MGERISIRFDHTIADTLQKLEKSTGITESMICALFVREKLRPDLLSPFDRFLLDFFEKKLKKPKSRSKPKPKP